MEACKVLGYTLRLNEFEQDTCSKIDRLIAIKQSKIEKTGTIQAFLNLRICHR